MIISSCNSAKEKSAKYDIRTDSAAPVTSNDLPDTAQMPVTSADETQTMIPTVDTIVTVLPMTDSAVSKPVAKKKSKAKSKKKEAKNSSPEATLAYSFKNKMRKETTIEIKVLVQLSKPVEELKKDLKEKLNEKNIADSLSSDTSIIKTLLCVGYSYYMVTLQASDPSAFTIVPQMPVKQQLKAENPAHWSWLVTAKKESSSPQFININVYGMEENISDTIDVCNIPIMVSLENSGMNAGGTIHVEPDPKPSGFGKYIWLTVIAALLLGGVIGFLIWKKRRKPLTVDQSRIFFSYAWNKDEELIRKLYKSLKKDGFNVVQDKEDLRYKGTISNFMTEIGKANFVIVAISDKYLRSRFCMFELYEIYRNTEMNKEEFGKRLFPLRTEEIDLGNPDIRNTYVDFWEAEEKEWEKRISDNSDSITEEDAKQSQFVRRLVAEIGNILSCLSDINALNINQLSENDFEKIKSSIRETTQAYEEKKQE